VNGREPKIFAEKCLKLFQDKLLRQSMGSSAKEKVQKDFSNDRMAREYYGLYSDIVGDMHA